MLLRRNANGGQRIVIRLYLLSIQLLDFIDFFDAHTAYDDVRWGTHRGFPSLFVIHSIRGLRKSTGYERDAPTGHDYDFCIVVQLHIAHCTLSIVRHCLERFGQSVGNFKEILRKVEEFKNKP